MNPTTQSARLPQRLRESAFRTYESIIAKAVSGFPKPVVVDPKGSPITFSYRLRDAMLSLSRYRWTTTVDMKRFDELYSEDRKLRQIHVSHIGELVSVGGDVDPTPSPSGDFVYTEPSTSDEPIEIVSRVQLTLVGRLAATRSLTKPLKVYGITVEDAEWLEDNMDVSVTDNGDNTFTIV